MTEQSRSEEEVEALEADTVWLTINPDDEYIYDRIRDDGFQRYLRRAHEGMVTIGDSWVEFVNDGCGSRTDVTICVRSVEGGCRIGPQTTFEWD